MRKVAILGAGMIPFGRRDEDTLMDMLAVTGLKAMDDAGIGDRPVDAVYVGNMGAPILEHKTGLASALVDRLCLFPAAAESIENGPASGGSAVKNGFLAVASGYSDLVLVVGAEKMRDTIVWKGTDFVATMTPSPGRVHLWRDSTLHGRDVCAALHGQIWGHRRAPGQDSDKESE